VFDSDLGWMWEDTEEYKWRRSEVGKPRGEDMV
jgi:hypothetical protein